MNNYKTRISNNIQSKLIEKILCSNSLTSIPLPPKRIAIIEIVIPKNAYFAFLLSNRLKNANKKENSKQPNNNLLIISIGYLSLNSSVVKYSGKRKQITAPKDINEKNTDKYPLILPSPILALLGSDI